MRRVGPLEVDVQPVNRPDRAFVATLLAEGMIDADVLLARARDLPVDAEHAQRLEAWVNRTVGDLEERG